MLNRLNSTTVLLRKLAQLFRKFTPQSVSLWLPAHPVSVIVMSSMCQQNMLACCDRGTHHCVCVCVCFKPTCLWWKQYANKHSHSFICVSLLIALFAETAFVNACVCIVSFAHIQSDLQMILSITCVQNIDTAPTYSWQITFSIGVFCVVTCYWKKFLVLFPIYPAIIAFKKKSTNHKVLDTRTFTP